MPRLISVALSFALFNTYAIPSISKVLAGSKQLLLPENASRRAEDTGVILAELMAEDGGLDGERATGALSRMNWLHRRYGSRITRDDLLYTLSLFIFVPTEWCEKFEWRPLTELEQEARYVFWREVGARMGITDIPRTRQELWDWQDAYATRVMVYVDTNAEVARTTTSIFLSPQPAVMRPLSRQASVVFLDERARKAFGLPRAPGWMYWLIPAVLRVRAWCIANLAMPRQAKPRWQEANVNVGADGKKRIQRRGYLFEPWYASKDSPAGIFGARLKPGEKWLCEGFEIEKVGPVHLMSKGNDEVLAAAAEMRQRAGTCPFFV